MKIYKKIKNYFSKYTSQPILSEDEYYENLFIKNDSWNKAEPNGDEQKRWAIIEEYIINIKKENNFLQILDLGCGRGWLTNLLSKYGNVLGIEPVAKVVAYAKKLYPNIDFVNGKTTDLLVEGSGKKFDLVVSSEVIEHVPDDKKNDFAKDIFELLKEDGYTIITTPRKDAQIEWNKYTALNQPIEDWISEDELKILFESNGFQLLDIKRIPVKPKKGDVFIDVYQVCLFKKINS